MSTNVVSAKDIRREWHLIDAKNQILGRLSTKIAVLLMGKNQANYVPYLDMGDNVVVVNASLVKVTGKKETQKTYSRHSGYPGGYREETLAVKRANNPKEIIEHSIKGMLPKTKLGKDMIKKLHVFAGNEHSFKDKFHSKEENSK